MFRGRFLPINFFFQFWHALLCVLLLCLCATCLALSLQFFFFFFSFNNGNASHLAFFGHGPPMNGAYSALSRCKPSFVAYSFILFFAFSLFLPSVLSFCFIYCLSFHVFLCADAGTNSTRSRQPFLSRSIRFTN